MGKGKRTDASDKKERMVEALVGSCDVPPELLHGGCFIEIRGRNSITVRGCRKIVRYSTETIVLRMKSELVEIRGKRLTCLTYLSGAVAVEGLIDSVCFVKTHNGEM